ncbi:hypothetical protein [uncultured Vibrio sp.]|uniref:hypothetical protein n=1 Tax=uncultured Vibrio sp. TaxID=114054 RepID=UPI002AA63EBB|nr:hypothetical protein [uncultured Vibrio sp.]
MLYKFVEKQFMDDFFERGSLRLGTILDFNDIVTHGTARGDTAEGQHGIIRNMNGELKVQGGKPEPIVDELFKIERDVHVRMNFKNVVLQVSRKCGDGFIFCTSNEYTDDLFRRWNLEEQTDACYQIFNPHGFYHEITKVIRSSVLVSGFKDVVYSPDPIPYNSPYAKESPAFTKEVNEYSWQKENRCVWEPLLPPTVIKPWIIEVPAARKYCRPFKILEQGSIKNYEAEEVEGT